LTPIRLAISHAEGNGRRAQLAEAVPVKIFRKSQETGMLVFALAWTLGLTAPNWKQSPPTRPGVGRDKKLEILADNNHSRLLQAEVQVGKLTS